MEAARRRPIERAEGRWRQSWKGSKGPGVIVEQAGEKKLRDREKNDSHSMARARCRRKSTRTIPSHPTAHQFGFQSSPTATPPPQSPTNSHRHSNANTKPPKLPTVPTSQPPHPPLPMVAYLARCLIFLLLRFKRLILFFLHLSLIVAAGTLLSR
mgnify:CR=1 FL=1